MSELRQVDFPAKDLPLRQDVSLLGQLLGETLVAQHGPELLEQVEAVRAAAIRLREQRGSESSPSGIDELETLLSRLDIEGIRQLVKAFSTYLRLANLAEKIHRIRRRRAYQKQRAASQRGSLEDVLAQLAREGVSADQAREALSGLAVRPIFTAHPTEATRRSFLEKEYSIVHRLVERLNPDLTPEEDRQNLDRIRDAIHSAWQTRSVPSTKPTVADELDNVLFYLTEILYRVAPPFYESLGQAFELAYGEALEQDVGQVLRLGSWVGGDMDGNPNVDASTLTQTLETQRRAVIRRYLPELSRMARYLSQTRGHAGFLPTVEQRLEAYTAQFPEAAAAIPARHRDMPYRCLLTLVATRLRATLGNEETGYSSAREFRDDVCAVGDSLEAHRGRQAGLFSVRRLQRRIETFGFHLATLDARQDSLVHRRVMGQLLGDADWLARSPTERTARLSDCLSGTDWADTDHLDAEGRSVLEVFRAIARGRQRFGNEAVGLFIISMTQDVDDVLTTLALAQAAGLGASGELALDVAPLLETVDDLDAGPRILQALLETPVYRRHLERRQQRQVIMVGYSDSNKDSGIVSARWSLHQAQTRLVAIGKQQGINIQFFHGRGGTVSRGGGNLVHGIEGAPPHSVKGYLRVTEQGEVINQKYGIRPIALRNLEIMAGAVLRHQLTDTGQATSAEDAARMDEMARDARSAFRDLVYGTPAFIDYFRSATPIDVIERLSIGSRPASRRSGAGIENLRAIPWVFSWAQVRIGLPGVYGLGTALCAARDQLGIATLRDMFQRWRFFQGLISDAEMVLGKSTLEVGERYAQLAPDSARPVFQLIRDELERATDVVLDIRETDTLLADQATLRRNIRLRNPYADPMHLLQISLLQRWREDGSEPGPVLDALKSTVHGIALAIQNTG